MRQMRRNSLLNVSSCETAKRMAGCRSSSRWAVSIATKMMGVRLSSTPGERRRAPCSARARRNRWMCATMPVRLAFAARSVSWTCSGLRRKKRRAPPTGSVNQHAAPGSAGQSPASTTARPAPAPTAVRDRSRTGCGRRRPARRREICPSPARRGRRRARTNRCVDLPWFQATAPARRKPPNPRQSAFPPRASRGSVRDARSRSR